MVLEIESDDTNPIQTPTLLKLDDLDAIKISWKTSIYSIVDLIKKQSDKYEFLFEKWDKHKFLIHENKDFKNLDLKEVEFLNFVRITKDLEIYGCYEYRYDYYFCLVKNLKEYSTYVDEGAIRSGFWRRIYKNNDVL